MTHSTICVLNQTQLTVPYEVRIHNITTLISPDDEQTHFTLISVPSLSSLYATPSTSRMHGMYGMHGMYDQQPAIIEVPEPEVDYDSNGIITHSDVEEDEDDQHQQQRHNQEVEIELATICDQGHVIFHVLMIGVISIIFIV